MLKITKKQLSTIEANFKTKFINFLNSLSDLKINKKGRKLLVRSIRDIKCVNGELILDEYFNNVNKLYENFILERNEDFFLNYEDVKKINGFKIVVNNWENFTEKNKKNIWDKIVELTQYSRKYHEIKQLV